MNTRYLALGTACVGVGLAIIACGGASETDVLGTPDPVTSTASSTSSSSSSSGVTGSSSSSSSGNVSSSSSSSSSGNTCVPCPTPVPQGCTANADPCSCNFVCPDAGGPKVCNWTKEDPSGGCGPNMFCDAPNCLKGVCVARPAAEQPNRDPQCGCDGVTYWNTTVAHKNGAPISKNGACANNVQVHCGGLGAQACPAGASCDHEVNNKVQCGLADGQGDCWMLPATCPPAAQNDKRSHACVGNACADECTAIRQQATWYDDSNCQ